VVFGCLILLNPATPPLLTVLTGSVWRKRTVTPLWFWVEVVDCVGQEGNGNEGKQRHTHHAKGC
jgi:hypothetical protein